MAVCNRADPGIGVYAPGLAALALGLGGGIYAGLRSPTVLVDVGRRLGLGAALDAARTGLGGIRGAAPAWALHCLPDALWLFAAVLVIRWYWAGRKRRASVGWSVVMLAIGWASELGQGLDLVAGTFDPLDLLAYAVGFAAALYVTRSRS